MLIKKIFKKEKVNINLKPIKINNSDIKDLYKKIMKIKKEIDDTLINEKTEKQFEMAEKDIEKTMNIKLHQNEIQSRPKKIWYESTKDKKTKEKKLRKEFEKKKKALYDDLEN